jgi:glycosyltransferase involved in cell wall biosynthesis
MPFALGRAMPPPELGPLTATVLICTYNRAEWLGKSLESLAQQVSTRRWDVLVVDNNSTDDTRAIVERAAAAFPVLLRYLFEPRQGKSHALNLGLCHTSADVVVFTDDDVKIEPGWIDAACEPLERDATIAYTGGPVRPMWEVPPPRWFDDSPGDHWGTLAILDYGRTPFIFEERKRIPLGVNMAVRRRLIEQIGGFHPSLGRSGRSLLGQEQAEFFVRARAAGARGRYVPAMELHHFVPAVRLTKSYYRRWWYWKGISRARVDAIHTEAELGLDLRTVPRIARVPRYVWGELLRATGGVVLSLLKQDVHAATRHEMSIAFKAGYVRGCWSRATVPLSPPTLDQTKARV